MHHQFVRRLLPVVGVGSLLGCWLHAAAAEVEAKAWEGLVESLTFYASFDGGADADFAKGDG